MEYQGVGVPPSQLRHSKFVPRSGRVGKGKVRNGKVAGQPDQKAQGPKGQGGWTGWQPEEKEHDQEGRGGWATSPGGGRAPMRNDF